MPSTGDPNVVPMPDQKPVHEGEVLGTLLREMMSAVQELEARRKFDTDIVDYLRERGITDEFEAWRVEREARNTATASGVIEP